MCHSPGGCNSTDVRLPSAFESPYSRSESDSRLTGIGRTGEKSNEVAYQFQSPFPRGTKFAWDTAKPPRSLGTDQLSGDCRGSRRRLRLRACGAVQPEHQLCPSSLSG